MVKVFIALTILVLVSSLIIFTLIISTDIEEKIDKPSNNKIYSGPVRIGDDLEYFRETGITREINNGS